MHADLKSWFAKKIRITRPYDLISLKLEKNLRLSESRLKLNKWNNPKCKLSLKKPWWF